MNVNFKSSINQGKSLRFLKSNDGKKTLFKKAPPPPPPTWDIGITTTSSNETFGIQLNGSSPNITVDWGDGTVENFTTIGNKTRTYATAGNYTVKILGSFGANGHIRLNDGQSRVQSTSVIPTISGLTNLGSCFFGCNLLTSIPSGLFANNTAVTDFSECFRSTSITSIPSGLFNNNTLVNNFAWCFAQSLLNVVPSDLFSNNTAVLQFLNTFRSCPFLNTVPSDLFANNTSATSFVECFFDTTLTTSSYSDLLINMASNAAFRQNNVLFGGGNSKYNLDGQTARQTLEAKNWTFTDLGLE